MDYQQTKTIELRKIKQSSTHALKDLKENFAYALD